MPVSRPATELTGVKLTQRWQQPAPVSAPHHLAGDVRQQRHHQVVSWQRPVSRLPAVDWRPADVPTSHTRYVRQVTGVVSTVRLFLYPRHYRT